MEWKQDPRNISDTVCKPVDCDLSLNAQESELHRG